MFYSPGRLHFPEFFSEEIAAGAEDDFVGGQRPVVGEEVDVEEVAALAEVVEDARSEESTAKAATFRSDLSRNFNFQYRLIFSSAKTYCKVQSAIYKSNLN